MRIDKTLVVHMAFVFTIGALVAGSLAWVEGLSREAVWASLIGAPLAIAYLFHFTFFYEVLAHEKGRRFFGWLTIVALVAGLFFYTFATLDIVVGVVLGVILPPLFRNKTMGRPEP